jgi:hypothetical protein
MQTFAVGQLKFRAHRARMRALELNPKIMDQNENATSGNAEFTAGTLFPRLAII